GQHLAAQRDLAGHGHVAAHRQLGQRGDEGGGRVMPAEGPSLGIAPSGTWMWMSSLRLKVGEMPSFSARERTYDMAACADSCITSPSLPVRRSAPLPGISVTSMGRISPPTSVQARPVARPISFCSSWRDLRKRGTPRYAPTFS